jgi:fructose-bisphosphate aldolase, class II
MRLSIEISSLKGQGFLRASKTLKYPEARVSKTILQEIIMLLNPLQARSLFAHAKVHQYAILAVNADSPAAINDCIEAARSVNAPIIVETSLWQLTGHSFGMGDPWLGMKRFMTHLELMANDARYAKIPVLYHTDHIKGTQALPLLNDAVRGLEINIGGSSFRLSPSTISLDSSELSETENINAILGLCRTAQASNRPVTLEMEAGVDDGLTPLEITERLIAPIEREFPGVIHLWAPGVGTQHGFSETGFPTFSSQAISQQCAFVKNLTGREIGLALHGSSGVPDQDLERAVKAGVVKVNWSSESLLIRSQLARDYYREFGAQLEKSQAKFKTTAMDNSLQQFISSGYVPKVAARISLLGGANRARELMNQGW